VILCLGNARRLGNENGWAIHVFAALERFEEKANDADD